MNDVRTWIEIKKTALEHNVGQFLKLIPKKTNLMAVVKSNAYGHGLTLISKTLASTASFKTRGWFGIDSLVEALRLRKEGIKNPMLVLGHTLPSRMREAKKANVVLSISNFETLRAVVSLKSPPQFHLKIDTGMHRQGFLIRDIPRLLSMLRSRNLAPSGIFTHFASAKDIAYPTYTQEQFFKFQHVVLQLKQSRFKNFITHAAASGGTILFPETHGDMVRIGMGLYGYWPSDETKSEKRKMKITLWPVLTWKTIIAEVKKIPRGAAVGYDCTERVFRPTTIAVLPIGYWHGYDRGLSGIGYVLVRGHRAKILGRVSMDMVVADVTGIRGVRVGDDAILIGDQKKESIWADELASKISTSPYEFLTRINPLIRRVLV